VSGRVGNRAYVPRTYPAHRHACRIEDRCDVVATSHRDQLATHPPCLSWATPGEAQARVSHEEGEGLATWTENGNAWLRVEVGFGDRAGALRSFRAASRAR
jgi:hypothetical protein